MEVFKTVDDTIGSSKTAYEVVEGFITGNEIMEASKTSGHSTKISKPGYGKI